MKVYLCYDNYYDFCDVWPSLQKIVSDEIEAMIWEEQDPSENKEKWWRSYEEWEVE